MELNNTPKAIKRLVDEIGHLQDLTHPNIIQYFGVEIHRVRVCRWLLLGMSNVGFGDGYA